MNNETKVGLLVVLALAVLGWLSVKSGSFGMGNSGEPTRELASVFSNVDGVEPGSAVKMAGVDIGTVRAVKLQPNGSAVLEMDVRSTIALPADITAQVATSGLIGERFIALVPGPAGSLGQGGTLAADARLIPSSGTADTQAIGNNFAKVADDLSSMTTTLRQVLGTPENAAKLQQIIDGLASFSGNVGNSGSLMADIEKTAANFAKISDDLANGKGTLGQLISGQGGGAGLDSLAEIGKAAKEIQAVMAKINQGQGTLGKLVNDPETAEKLNGALDTFGEVAQRMEQIRTEVAFEASSLTNEQGIGKGEFSLTLAPRPNRFYVLGATADGFASAAKSQNEIRGPYFGKDFGNKTQVTAQFGHMFPNAVANQDIAVRVGLKNSTGGVGVDTFGKVPVLDTDVKYSVDAYDFAGNNTPGSSSPHVDITARADLIGKTVYGVVGYDNLLNQEYGSPKVGVGMKFQDDDLKYFLGQAL